MAPAPHDTDWEDPVAADLVALGRKPPTGLSAYDNPDPVESGAPDLPGEVLTAPVEEFVLPAPLSADEFTCTTCWLVKCRTLLAPGCTDSCLDCT